MTRKKWAAEKDLLLHRHGFGACGHPDCDPKTPTCASNYIRAKAEKLAAAAYRRGARAGRLESSPGAQK